jgi:hypothetical protein
MPHNHRYDNGVVRPFTFHRSAGNLLKLPRCRSAPAWSHRRKKRDRLPGSSKGRTAWPIQENAGSNPAPGLARRSPPRVYPPWFPSGSPTTAAPLPTIKEVL